MNIFVVNDNPVKAAQDLPDKILSKMSLESCQMLAVAFFQKGWGYLPKKSSGKYNKSLAKVSRLLYLSSLQEEALIVAWLCAYTYGTRTHRNHPCTKWVGENYANMGWLLVHAMALALEHRHRFGRLPATFRTLKFAQWLYETNTELRLCNVTPTDFVRAMPDDIKLDTSLSHVEAYRKYMRTKTYIGQYHKGRPQPSWI